MGSEMCIRDRDALLLGVHLGDGGLDHVALAVVLDRLFAALVPACLLYTSDAADERSSVDLGGRRIIKKQKTVYSTDCCRAQQQHALCAIYREWLINTMTGRDQLV